MWEVKLVFSLSHHRWTEIYVVPAESWQEAEHIAKDLTRNLEYINGSQVYPIIKFPYKIHCEE